MQKSWDFLRAHEETKVLTNVCAYLRDTAAHREDADLLRTVLKDCGLVGGLTALHTLEITIIKAGEVSQYGRRGAPRTTKKHFSRRLYRKTNKCSFFLEVETYLVSCTHNESTVKTMWNQYKMKTESTLVLDCGELFFVWICMILRKVGGRLGDRKRK